MGFFTYTFTANDFGSWRVIAIWNGNDNYEGFSSSLITFTVKKLGCLVATATSGSELSPQVQFLRGFRDNIVLSTFAGNEFMRIFNEFYYSFSPNVTLVIADNSPLRDIMKVILYPLIGILHLGSAVFSAFSVLPELSIILAGLIASALIGIVYFMPIALIFSYFKKYKVSEKKMHWMRLIWLSSVLFLVNAEVFKILLMLMVSTGLFVLVTMSTGLFVLVTMTTATLISLRIVSKNLIQ